MTKEELKLEALKYLENFKDCANCKHRWGDCADELDEDCLINNCYSATPKEQDIYLAGAEPREKRIAELEQALSAMEKGTCDICKVKDAEFYEKQIAELEAQIKKMQNCRNCKNEKIEGACGHFTQVGWCRDWKLAD